jgi:hypothetical protein
VVARKIPENFDAHFSFLRARKIPRILVAAQSAGAHAHFSNTPNKVKSIRHLFDTFKTKYLKDWP